MSSDDSDSSGRSRSSGSDSDSASPPPKKAPVKTKSKPQAKKSSDDDSSDDGSGSEKASSDDGSGSGSGDDSDGNQQSSRGSSSASASESEDNKRSSKQQKGKPSKSASKQSKKPAAKSDNKSSQKKSTKKTKKHKNKKGSDSDDDSGSDGSGSGSNASDADSGDEEKQEEKPEGQMLKGHLKKLGGKTLSKWQIRFMVLSQGKLSYFLNSKAAAEGGQAKGSIDVQGATIHILPYDRYKRQHAFTITPADDKSKAYGLRCRVAQDRTDWITGLMAAGAADVVDQTSDKGSSEGCHSGWLVKRGQGRASWKRRFFHLDRRMLEYFDTPERKKGRGSMVIDGSGLTVYEKKEFGRDFAIGITQTSGRHAGKPRILVALSEDERVAWCNSLIKQGAVPDKTTSDMLQRIETARKDRLQSTSKVPTSQAKAKLAMCRVTLEGGHMGFITVAVPSSSTVSEIVEKTEGKLKMKGVPPPADGLEYRLILGVQVKDAELLDPDTEITELGDLKNVLTFTMVKHDPNAKQTSEEEEGSGSDSGSDSGSSGSGSGSGSDSFHTSGDDNTDSDSDGGSSGENSGSGSGKDSDSASESSDAKKPTPKKGSKKPAPKKGKQKHSSSEAGSDSDSAPPPKKPASKKPLKKAASSDEDDDDSSGSGGSRKGSDSDDDSDHAPPPKRGGSQKKQQQKKKQESSDSDSESDSDSD